MGDMEEHVPGSRGGLLGVRQRSSDSFGGASRGGGMMYSNVPPGGPGGGAVVSARAGPRSGRSTKVKNKQPAPLQITAEQILREALERQESEIKPPRQRITDPEELEEYRLMKRKSYEDNIRRNRFLVTNWIKYAQWEETQGEFERARSVFERALDEDYRNVTLWLKYAEMEMRNKNVNRARNIWDRAVTLLPRVSQFWYKYTYMEDVLGNYAGARQVFERWMDWHPVEHAWMSFVKFETRLGEKKRARAVFERFVACHPSVKSWLKWAKFEEEECGDVNAARSVYTRAVESLGDEANDEKLFVAFAKFEERCHEDDRARAIYKYALDHIEKPKAQDLYRMFVAFEKTHGDRVGIEDVIISKRRFQYEEEVKLAPTNYDAWFDYLRLEEEYGNIEKIRETYERAIAAVPPASEKRFWRRYIYLWIKYAIFEELVAKDIPRTREVYKACIGLIPHKKFSFCKVWTMYAKFEVRHGGVDAARSVFGQALGVLHHSPKVYDHYLKMELQLGEVERCRKLYVGLLSANPTNCKAWTEFAEMEKGLNEIERARGVLELAVSQGVLDMPELLWKHYIDFEISLGEMDRVRSLYRRLLQRTKHVKVWISFAQFEHSVAQSDDNSRALYSEAHDFLKSEDMKDERVMLLESWLAVEKEIGDAQCIDKVQKMMPKRVKKRRLIKADDGSDAGWEEYWHYIFPGEEAGAPNLKLLERAHLWKRQRLAGCAVQVINAQESPASTSTAATTTTIDTTTSTTTPSSLQSKEDS
ncbi:CGI-201 protein, short form [Pelomyxa schiedti]|nr:CGI-201 protein, short form [Pelomyxa schiedti]